MRSACLRLAMTSSRRLVGDPQAENSYKELDAIVK